MRHAPRRHALALSAALAIGLGAAAAGAVTLDLVLDPGQSSLTPAAGPAASLAGSLRLSLGALPPLASPTTFDLLDAQVAGGGLSIVLDPDLANPALGVLYPDASFLFPTVFLSVDAGGSPFDQTLLDVAGSFGPSPACGSATCFEADFDVDTLGPQGIVSVHLVAAVPEPGTLLTLALALLGLVLAGTSTCNGGRVIAQDREEIPGYAEPHTPGSGAPEEVAIPAGSPIRQILGANVDLNRVTYVRTHVSGAGAPKAILVLIPGFLGGSGSFDPLARDLVRAFNGALEVWAVDRRSNQLEDRRGGLHARAGAELGASLGDTPAMRQAVAEGVRFYYPTADLDEDGSPDGAFALPDAQPGDGPSAFQRLAQDDMRFAAHWGADTYARDWRELVLAARAVVGPQGLVLFGGHSLGTSWAGIFAAYDFDPGPGVEAGHQLIDGVLLLEGGGPGAPSGGAANLATYQATVANLATPGGPNVYLPDLFGFVNAVDIGTAGELNGVAGTFLPDDPSVMQRTPLFGGIPISILLQAPATNRSLVGFFLDDEFSTNTAFSASLGFSDNGTNVFNPIPFLVPGEYYIALDEGFLRSWKDFDDPTLPSCPPVPPPPFPTPTDVGATGCALIDNGPRPAPTDPPRRWGMEREVTDIATFTRSLYETGNASEWYFVSGRPGLDLAYGRDASGLGDASLLNTTQNATMDKPILAIGGSNGLAPTERSFAGYLGSTASTDTTVVILEGYAHVDVTSAADNDAVPPIVDWIARLQRQKLLGGP